MKMISLHKGNKDRFVYGLLALMLSSFAIWHEASAVRGVGPWVMIMVAAQATQASEDLQQQVRNFLLGGSTTYPQGRLAFYGLSRSNGFEYSNVDYTQFPAHISLLQIPKEKIDANTRSFLSDMLRQLMNPYKEFTFRNVDAFWPYSVGNRVWIVAWTPATSGQKGFYPLAEAFHKILDVQPTPFRAHISLATIDGQWTTERFEQLLEILKEFNKTQQLPAGVFNISEIVLGSSPGRPPFHLWP